MKLGFFAALFGDRSLDEVLEIIRPLKLDTIELGTGNYPGAPHIDVDDLIKSKTSRTALMNKLRHEGLKISALSCHGNALHPDPAFAKQNVAILDKTIKLANKLGVKTIVDFSGCPGSDEKAKRPCWVTCPWPDDYLDTLNWQWEKKVVPFWSKKAKLAADNGVRIAFEAHPGFVVYNPETIVKIRKLCGNNLGANFDPSHFFWQGIDPVEAVRYLGGKAIFHVHAKDSKVYEQNAKINGVLDVKHYGDEINRSWIFRTCGYGHDADWWNDFISTLRMVGYDGPISIEHEDSLMSNVEGLTKAVDFLKKILIFQKKSAVTWA
jgi:sugar phosphate isomerase/epimerase